MGKGEIACYDQLFLFPQCFQKDSNCRLVKLRACLLVWERVKHSSVSLLCAWKNLYVQTIFCVGYGGIIAAGEITPILPVAGEKQPENLTKFFFDAMLQFMVSEVSCDTFQIYLFIKLLRCCLAPRRWLSGGSSGSVVGVSDS